MSDLSIDKLREIANIIFEFSPGMGLDEVQAEYQDRLYNSMADYLQSTRPITAFKNEFRRTVNDGFTFAFVAGWADAGASGPITADAQSWLNGRIEQEISFANTLFTDLKALRENPEIPMSAKLEAAEQHAAAYTNTLTGVYSQGKMQGEPERDGEWRLGATEEHCQSDGGTMGCAQLDRQVHPMSWYLKKGYIPQEAGSPTLTCGGWRCLCTIVDPKTGAQLIP